MNKIYCVWENMLSGFEHSVLYFLPRLENIKSKPCILCTVQQGNDYLKKHFQLINFKLVWLLGKICEYKTTIRAFIFSVLSHNLLFFLFFYSFRFYFGYGNI